MLLKIEGTTVLFEEALKDRHGHGKSADKICNSCRSVIMMKFLPENTYSDEFFGKNCWPFIFRLAESGTHINIWPMTSAAHFDWYEDKAHLIRINGKPVKDISELIDSLYDWWSDLFDDDLVKDIVAGVDRGKVLFQEALADRFGKGMSSEMLSNSSKSLICMRMLPTHTYCLSYVGENCIPFMYKIAEAGTVIDVFCDSSPYMFYPDPIVNLMSCNREPIGSFEEFLDMYDDWWAGEVGKFHE